MFLSSTSPATSSKSIWLSCSHLITYEAKSILKGPSAPKSNVSLNIFFWIGCIWTSYSCPFIWVMVAWFAPISDGMADLQVWNPRWLYWCRMHAPLHFSTLLHFDILGKYIWSRLPAALSTIFSSLLHRSNFWLWPRAQRAGAGAGPPQTKPVAYVGSHVHVHFEVYRASSPI